MILIIEYCLINKQYSIIDCLFIDLKLLLTIGTVLNFASAHLYWVA